MKIFTFGIILITVIAMGSMVAAQAKQGAGPRDADGYSKPADLGHLLQQIELRMKFDNGTEFQVATRPGQGLYVTRRDAQLLKERRMMLTIMPATADGVVLPLEKSLEVSKQNLRFRINPSCLNVPGTTPVIDNTTNPILSPKTCLEREVDDGLDNEVAILRDLAPAVERTAIGASVREVVVGADLQVLAYRRSLVSDPDNIDPYANCCLEQAGVRVCACSVAMAGASCFAGCLIN